MPFTLPIPIFSILAQYGISILILAMLVRAIASWFGMDERVAFIRFLAHLTDPFITPFRRIMRPVGVLDFSFLVAFFVLITLQRLLIQAIPPGW